MAEISPEIEKFLEDNYALVCNWVGVREEQRAELIQILEENGEPFPLITIREFVDRVGEF